MPPSNNPASPSQEDYTAARIFHQNYYEQAVFFLAQHDPIQLLKNACAVRGHKFHSVMAENDTSPEDDTRSQTSSRRRKNSSNSHSPFDSSASVIQSSSGSSNSSSTVHVWISPDNGSNDGTSIKARRDPQSNSLIRADVVTRHLKLAPIYLSGPCRAQYNHMNLSCESKITLDWAWSAGDLSSGRTQQTTFYLVENLPGSDVQVVLGNSSAPDNDVGSRQTGQPKSFVCSPMARSPPNIDNHGPHLQHIPGTRSYTENSTTPTVKPISTNRRDRGSSSGSIAQDTSTSPLPPLGHAGATSTCKVTMICGGNQMPVRLELDATGEDFFNTLKSAVKKLERKLDRSVDYVRLSPQKDSINGCCLVYLKEDQVGDDWEDAREWFSELAPKTRIYAIIERDNGDDDDDDDD